MTVEERAKQMLQQEEAFLAALEQKIKEERVWRIGIEMTEQKDLVQKRIDLIKKILGQ
jgi:hypothetical protein